uniref:Synaptogyrin 3 n=1 Tax=Equus asinus TaxID=9793 RepID=A0A9L0J3H7_EQUAS
SAPPGAPSPRPARAPGRRQRQRLHQHHRQQPRAASGGAGRTDRPTEGAGGAWPARASHGGSLVWRGSRGGRPGPRELRAAAPDPAAGRVLGLTQSPSSALAPFFLFSRSGSGHRGGTGIRGGAWALSFTARTGLRGGAERIRQSLPLLLPYKHPPGSFEGSWPFPGPPVATVFSIAVFGPIINEGYVNADSGPELRCVFNGNAGACRFGVVLGLGAFLACAAFLLLDVRFQQISSVRDRRRAVLLDLGFSGLWSFLWFVGFCFLTNQWQRTAPGQGTMQAEDAARAAIAFSFFSIFSWAALTVKALQRFRLGTDMSLFATEQLGAGAGQGYPGYPVGSGVEGTETYQNPPFTETLDTNPKGYQVPAY